MVQDGSEFDNLTLFLCTVNFSTVNLRSGKPLLVCLRRGKYNKQVSGSLVMFEFQSLNFDLLICYFWFCFVGIGNQSVTILLKQNQQREHSTLVS